MLVFVFMSFILMQSYLCCFCVYLVLAKLDLFDSASPLHCFKNRNCQQSLLIKQKQSRVVMLWQQRKLQFCKKLVVLYTSHLYALYVENGQFNFAVLFLCWKLFSVNVRFLYTNGWKNSVKI